MQIIIFFIFDTEASIKQELYNEWLTIFSIKWLHVYWSVLKSPYSYTGNDDRYST